jgi:hypothetical protein
MPDAPSNDAFGLEADIEVVPRKSTSRGMSENLRLYAANPAGETPGLSEMISISTAPHSVQSSL